jgi:hypothetical protein
MTIIVRTRLQTVEKLHIDRNHKRQVALALRLDQSRSGNLPIIKRLHARRVYTELCQYCLNTTVGRRLDVQMRDFIAFHGHNEVISG